MCIQAEIYPMNSNAKLLVSQIKKHYNEFDGLYSTNKDNLNYKKYHDSVVNIFPLKSKKKVVLKLLDIQDHHVGIDYGCCSFSLLNYAAHSCELMLSCSNDAKKLFLMKNAVKNSGLNNCIFIRFDTDRDILFDNAFDFSILSFQMPKTFLKTEPINIGSLCNSLFLLELENSFKLAFNNLKKGGKLFFSFMNRFSYTNFFQKKDKYSCSFINRILISSGFSKIDIFASFPDNIEPERIIPVNKKNFTDFKASYNYRLGKSVTGRMFNKVNVIVDNIIFKYLKLYHLSPSFIIIATK